MTPSGSNYMINKNKPDLFRTLTFFISKKVYLRALKAVYVDRCTDISSEFADFLNTRFSIREWQSFRFCKCFEIRESTQLRYKNRKGAWKARFRSLHCRFIRKAQK